MSENSIRALNRVAVHSSVILTLLTILVYSISYFLSVKTYFFQVRTAENVLFLNFTFFSLSFIIFV